MNDKTTLDINPETVSYIVNLARDFYAKEQISDLEEQEPNVQEGWEDTIREQQIDPVHAELKTAIEDLEPDQQVQLVALMWLGRGSFSEWDSAMKEAGDNWNSKTADYLIGTPLLSDYLEEGLNQLGYVGEDYEV